MKAIMSEFNSHATWFPSPIKSSIQLIDHRRCDSNPISKELVEIWEAFMSLRCCLHPMGEQNLNAKISRDIRSLGACVVVITIVKATKPEVHFSVVQVNRQLSISEFASKADSVCPSKMSSPAFTRGTAKYFPCLLFRFESLKSVRYSEVAHFRIRYSLCHNVYWLPSFAGDGLHNTAITAECIKPPDLWYWKFSECFVWAVFLLERYCCNCDFSNEIWLW